jgi:hypothetical protein
LWERGPLSIKPFFIKKGTSKKKCPSSGKLMDTLRNAKGYGCHKKKIKRIVC